MKQIKSIELVALNGGAAALYGTSFFNMKKIHIKTIIQRIGKCF